MIGIAPFTLEPQETVLVSFAVLAGSGLAGPLTSSTLYANADAAAARWEAHWGAPTDVSIPQFSELPDRIDLAPPNPNPLRDRTMFTFSLPRDSQVRLEIFDIAGRRVAGLLDGRLPAGRHSYSWNGRDGAARFLSSGVYYVRLRDGRGMQTQKLLIAR